MSSRAHRRWSTALALSLTLDGCGAPAPEPLPAATPAPVELTVTFDDMPMASTPSQGTRLDVPWGMIAPLATFGFEGVYPSVNPNNLDTPTRAQAIAVLQAWIEAGHHLGNHTYSHYFLGQILHTNFMTDIRRNEPILASVSTEERYKVFRYPFLIENDEGNHGPEIRRFLRERGYTISPVTLNVADWMYGTAYGRCLATRETEEQEWVRRSTQAAETSAAAAASSGKWRTVSVIAAVISVSAAVLSLIFNVAKSVG